MKPNTWLLCVFIAKILATGKNGADAVLLFKDTFTQKHKRHKMIHLNLYTELLNFAAAIEHGKTNPLVAYTELKKFSDLIAWMMDQVKDAAVEERRKFGKEEVIKNGFKIELASGRKIWKYDSSQRWNELNQKRKLYEELMQKAYSGAEIADAETGEIIPAAELTFSRDTIRLIEVNQ
jgi:hypothetical protein